MVRRISILVGKVEFPYFVEGMSHEAGDLIIGDC